jgi:hypothetical protein
VDLCESKNKQIVKFLKKYTSVYEDCSDSSGDDDSSDEEYDYYFYENRIKKYVGIEEDSDIKVMFHNCAEEESFDNVFIGVKLKSICDTKAGHEVRQMDSLPLRQIIKQKKQAQLQYGEQLTNAVKILFPEKEIKPDIVFISDVE